MHFRQFLLSALMVGAAILFPDNAFAENNELASQKGQAHPSEKSNNNAVKINVPAIAEQVKPLETTVTKQEAVPEKAVVPKQAAEKAVEPKQATIPEKAAIPEHARVNQAEAKQPQAKGNPNQDMLKSLPDQARGNGKPEKTVEETGHDRAEAVQKKKQMLLDKLDPISSFQTTEKKVEVEEAKRGTVEPQGEDSAITKSVPVEHVPEKVPTSKEEIFKQMVNQTQRNNSSGGQSHDRVIQGLNTSNLLDKWFDWDTYVEMKLIQPYLSRLALMNTQWVNAPPAPPPEKAPLLKNVTRS
ncbi:hypothetical protein [Neobacillus vireti]|uniref:hypothetical protein n=1 Tax=Neobacillus vireti TaxID=220686 RepID=UPI002FFFEDA7